MKIVLINPPQIFSKYQVATGIVPPLGIAYLASYCLKEGIDVQIVDSVGEESTTVEPFREDIFLRGMSIADIVKSLDTSASLIGISNLFSFAYPAVVELTKALKEAHPQVPIVLGGPHPSALPEYCLDTSAADFVVRGEGELSLVELCRHLAGEISADAVPSLVYLDDEGKIIRSKQAPRILDLDSSNLPFPARHLLPMENYIAAQEAHGSVEGRWTTILSSRGCPYGCTFCDSRRTKYVARTAKDVVDEIEHCIRDFGIREFHFEDDNLTLKKTRTLELCQEIIDRGLRIKWQTPNGIRASVTDERMLGKMMESGCNHITLAPESGSPRVLKDIIQKGKDFSLDQLLDVGKLAHKMGMKCAAYFVLGLPGETAEDLDLTIKYANRLARAGVDEAGFGLFIPLPGTPLWDKVVKEYGQPDFLDLLVIGDLNKAISWSSSLGSDELNSFRRKAHLTFQMNRAIFHPRAFSRTLINVLRGIAETKTESYLRTFIKRTKSKSSPSGAVKAGKYTAYDSERTVAVLLKSVPHYAFSNSGYKAALTVVSDFSRRFRNNRES